MIPYKPHRRRYQVQTVFKGSLTHADSKRHIMHGFEVPENAVGLRAALEHRPARARGADYVNQVSLSLFDPQGARGTRHNNADQTIHLSAGGASPGYLPGAILPGRWTVVLDAHRILPPDTLEYRITVDVDTRPPGEDPASRTPAFHTPGRTARRGPGWYRGELHSHTLHSDGSWDVPDLAGWARGRGLDFLALTDHNTVSGLPELDSLGDDDLLTIGGMELTTFRGHALMLGTREWHEWREVDGHTMEGIARSVLDKGRLFVIAHPLNPGDPQCSGCRWEYESMMPGIAPAVEIWNGPWRDVNEAGLALFYRWLSEGRRLAASAGGDIHGPPPADAVPGAVNVVHAEEFSEEPVLAAIRRGHLYLSTGPELHLEAFSLDASLPADGSGDSTGDSTMKAIMGDTISGARRIRVRCAWEGAHRGDRLRLIADTGLGAAPREDIPAQTSGEREWELPGGTVRWFLMELRSENGEMRAITNPIFVERQAASPRPRL